MNKYYLSLNQFAEFTGSTDTVRKRIISQQLEPNPFKIPWYQLTKSRVKKYFELNGDLTPIYDGINILMKRVPKTKRQLNDKMVSIEAFERFILLKMPTILKNIDYTIVKPKNKILSISDVDIIVAPEIIVKGKINGQTVLGGIKIHVSKSSPFDYKKSIYVSSIIYKFICDEIAKREEIVLPELCFSLDIFGERLVSAPKNVESVIAEVEKICNEVKIIWIAA